MIGVQVTSGKGDIYEIVERPRWWQLIRLWRWWRLPSVIMTGAHEGHYRVNVRPTIVKKEPHSWNLFARYALWIESPSRSIRQEIVKSVAASLLVVLGLLVVLFSFVVIEASHRGPP